MIVFPNAKINIGLFITEKRNDGFHNIESIFYPVEWNDILEITPSNKLTFESSGIEIPGDKLNNLCVKAYNLIKSDYDIPPVDIRLHKIIPIGAGLGGGSADASFTLKAINEMFGLGITNEKLISYAQKLGSDCAFFIENKPKFCFNKGDEFSDSGIDLSDFWIELINPEIHISTKEAYAGVIPQSVAYDLRNLHEAFIQEWKLYVKNDFEDSIFPNHPKIESIKTNMYDRGALYASMSGSGSTVFGIYKDEPNKPNSNQGIRKVAKLR